MNSFCRIISYFVALALILPMNCNNQQADKEEQKILQLLALSGAAAAIASSPTGQRVELVLFYPPVPS